MISYTARGRNDDIMDCLYHYFEKSVGPFVSLSDLPIEEAHLIQDKLKRENKTFAAHRYDGYLY
ncbi:hypothetical protein FACS189490_08870 [Clostridia bacterium]|nr:hypothetical protein FACS189490_08870 [Clostridia bacterium]